MRNVTSLQAPRTDAFVRKARDPVPVTALTTVVIAPTNVRGYDSVIVFIANLGADTFTGTIEFSPDGIFPGAVVPDDAFADMAPGVTRWTRIPADAQFFRVTGIMAAIAGDVEVSIILQRNSR